MARILDDISRTFSEYLLIPQLTTREHTPGNICIETPLGRFKEGSTSHPVSRSR